jgi:hypothetical protein
MSPLPVVAALCLMLSAGVSAVPSAGAAGDSARELQLQDFSVLQSDYLSKDGAFSPEERSRAIATIAAYEERAGSLSPAEMFLAVSEVVAIADNGHSHVGWGQSPDQPKKRLPLKLAVFGDRILIVRALPEFSALAGAEILGVDGRGTAQLWPALQKYFPSALAGKSWRAVQLIEPAGLLHAAGLANLPDRLSLQVRTRDGQTLQRTIPFVANESVRSTFLPGILIAPDSSPPPAVQWVPALDAVDLPLYLEDG